MKKHKMMAWGFKTVGFKEFPLKMKTLLDENNIEDSFVLALIEQLKEIQKIYDNPIPIIEESVVGIPNICFLCSKPLNGDIVRDHDHLTGLFRGIQTIILGFSHNVCNLKHTKLANFIPIYFHNLGKYNIKM
jgi:hypothetical protein